jgi:hypothetical protein
MGQVLRLRQAHYRDEFIAALTTKVGALAQEAWSCTQKWLNDIFWAVNESIKEQRIAYSRRQMSLARIQQVSTDLEVKISEIEERKRQLLQAHQQSETECQKLLTLLENDADVSTQWADRGEISPVGTLMPTATVDEWGDIDAPVSLEDELTISRSVHQAKQAR